MCRHGDAVIELAGIAKTYTGPQGPVSALRDISLNIARGEIFGVIGRSGAGKTTLLRCINLVERPDAGAVRVDGQELTQLDDGALAQARRKIGMIFQHFNLLSARTAFENVALPLEIAGVGKTEIARRVPQLLERVGLGDKAHTYPAKLSSGQKQRVGIARSLANRPQVMLCDEATSALDPETTTQILDLLRDIQREDGLTVVLITHEMSVVKHVADRVAVMEGGQIVEQGSVFDVFTAPQSQTAKRFVAETAGEAVPPELAARAAQAPGIGPHTLLDLVFRGDAASQPVVSILSRQFGLDLNIVAGRVESIQGRAYGRLAAVASGDPARIAQAVAYLRSVDVSTEVLGHVAADGRTAA